MSNPSLKEEWAVFYEDLINEFAKDFGRTPTKEEWTVILNVISESDLRIGEE